MEQNARKFGAFVATLAMIASLLVMPSVSAADNDLHVSLSGDDGTTSYASELGYANFTATISSATDAAHTDVTVEVGFVDANGAGSWNMHQATISDCVGNGTTGSNVTGNLSTSSTMDVCISVDIEVAGAEASKSMVTMLVNVTSVEDTATGHDADGTIQIVNWVISSSDGTQYFEESDATSLICSEKPNCQSYTLTVENIKIDLDGSAVATDEVITLRLGGLPGDGWSLNTSYSGWSIMDGEATIDGLDAGQSLSIVFELTLDGGNVPATSYLAEEYNQIVFENRDDDGFIVFTTIYAIVADNFNAFVHGAATANVVDNGCDNPDEVANVYWNVSIKNSGNTYDTFDIAFDIGDAQGAAWSVANVDGSAMPSTTSQLKPSLGKTGSGDYTYDFQLVMTIPGGEPAGESHGFTMTVSGDNIASETVNFGATVEQCFDIELAIDGAVGLTPAIGFANPGSLATFNVTATNYGNGEDTVSFITMGNALWSPEVSVNVSTIVSGASASITFSLTVPGDSEAGSDSAMAMVHAYSEGCSEQTAGCDYEEHVSAIVTTNQLFDIKAGYYSNESGIAKSSMSIEEGMMKEMKFNVTNNGNGGEVVTLSLVDAPDWVVLSQLTATVPAFGGIQTVSVDVSAPSSGALGDHTFKVMATSQDGETTSTTDFLTITVVAKGSSDGPTTETVDDEEGWLPGFSAISAIAAIGAALIIRRRL